MKLAALRKKYPAFLYKRYSYKKKGRDLHIAFEFAAPPDIVFHPRVVIQDVPNYRGNIENLVFHLGLVEMLSYWKATCSPKIVVQAGKLTARQISWLQDLTMQGMGEYFFENKIDFTKKDFLTITSTPRDKLNLVKFINLTKLSLRDRALVPVGGGKDAAVTLELLKQGGMSITPFVLNPKKEQLEIMKASKAGKPIVVKRTIDKKLLELNQQGYLNGHTPFSAYLAFLTVLVAAIFDYKYIALSNERSSNYGNVKYLGKTINHQYSKTYEFEQKFRKYSTKYLASGVEYFSFLRPLWELQIAQLFAQYQKYHSVFLSCNTAHKTKSGSKKPTGKWCGKCAKCLFVFLALYPFLGEKDTVKIFNKNLLKDKKLKPLLDELTGKKRFKPFECVGTAQETRAAIALQDKTRHPLLKAWNSKHFLPKKFESILKAHVK